MKKINFVEFLCSFPNKIDFSMKCGDFRKLLEENTKIKADNQYIRIIPFFHGDDFSLQESIELEVYDTTSFPIKIKLNDYSKILYFDLNKSIEELKKIINEKFRIPSKSIQFFLENKFRDNKNIYIDRLFENELSIKITEPPIKKLIKVKYPNGDIKEICTDLLNTGFSFLEELLEKTFSKDIPFDLYYNNKLITITDLLSQYDIKEGDFIDLKERENISIKVKTLTGGTFEYKINKNDTILLLRLMLQKDKGIQVEESDNNLFFSGKKLENDQTFGYYNIQEGSVLYLVLRLRG